MLVKRYANTYTYTFTQTRTLYFMSRMSRFCVVPGCPLSTHYTTLHTNMYLRLDIECLHRRSAGNIDLGGRFQRCHGPRVIVCL